ncbi:hypothetical protein [Fimbriiglobus ruber]|uniref:hypothetical protein n=1 Tax=Fimbriiglobus ruber TaxID=1908690 RepID=UPI000B4BB4E5|nr:hypothetical protein [Fimbriiglobus ruber]
MHPIAEHRIDFLYPDGEMVPVRIRLGCPFVHPKGGWTCAVQAEGLRIWQGPSELFGEGSFHALVIGVRFLHRMLVAEIERGAVPHWEGGVEALEIDELFVLWRPKNH